MMMMMMMMIRRNDETKGTSYAKKVKQKAKESAQKQLKDKWKEKEMHGLENDLRKEILISSRAING